MTRCIRINWRPVHSRQGVSHDGVELAEILPHPRCSSHWRRAHRRVDVGLRSRQLHELAPFSEAVRNIAVFYDGLVVPGALLLLISGTWMIVQFYGGWNFLQIPWLAGMVGLFAFEFIEGNTITRLYFMRLRRLTRSALDAGYVTSELQRARGEPVPTFTHFLDLPGSAYTVSHHSSRRHPAHNLDLVLCRLVCGNCACDDTNTHHSPAVSLAPWRG